MESLQTQKVMTRYGGAMRDLWNRWLILSVPARQSAMRDAIQSATAFMVSPVVTFQNLGANVDGGLSEGTWALVINRDRLIRDDITFSEFLELASTLYHEARHAEQYFRMAQGLASGLVEFPSTWRNFGTQTQNRARDIAAALGIPLNVVERAEMVRFHYRFWVKLQPLPHVAKTWHEEVEEWLDSCFGQGRKALTEFAQQGGSQGIDAAAYLYRQLPEEVDAHAIGDLAMNEVILATGYQNPTWLNLPRTDTGTFGR